MDRRIASPLSRLEDETRLIDKSRLSSQSSESVVTTGRLLDKLNLNDEDWNDPPDYSDHASYYEVDESESSNAEINSNIPMFESLKSVLGSQRGETQSAVNRVMELGKRVNTVEQSRPKVMKRSTIHSIHLDSLIQDGDDDDDGDNDDSDGYNEDNGRNSDESTHTFKEEELSFIPQTPTRSMKTPTSSPRNLILTPRSQLEPVSPMFQHKYSNSQVQSVKSNSSFGECIPETFLYNRPSEETVFNGPHHMHTKSHDISIPSEVTDLNRSASLPVRKPSVKQSPTPSQELPSLPKSTTPQMAPPTNRYGTPRQQYPQYPSNNMYSTASQQYSNVPFHKRKLQYQRNHQQAYNQVYPHLYSTANNENEMYYYHNPPPSTPPMNRSFIPASQHGPSYQGMTTSQGFSPGNPYAPHLISSPPPLPSSPQQQQQPQHWPAGIHPNVSPRLQQQYKNGPSSYPRPHPNFPINNSKMQQPNNPQRYGYSQSTGIYSAKSPNKKKPTTFQDVDLSNIIPR